MGEQSIGLSMSRVEEMTTSAVTNRKRMVKSSGAERKERMDTSNLRYCQKNIMLNELDKEMEQRGLSFVRYADDCIIMVRSEMSARRVMRNLTRFIEEKLGLKVNMTKSKVDRPSGLKYLGFGFYFDGRTQQIKAKPHAKSVEKFKARMKQLTCRSWGV